MPDDAPAGRKAEGAAKAGRMPPSCRCRSGQFPEGRGLRAGRESPAAGLGSPRHSRAIQARESVARPGRASKNRTLLFFQKSLGRAAWLRRAPRVAFNRDPCVRREAFSRYGSFVQACRNAAVSRCLGPRAAHAVRRSLERALSVQCSKWQARLRALQGCAPDSSGKSCALRHRLAPGFAGSIRRAAGAWAAVARWRKSPTGPCFRPGARRP